MRHGLFVYARERLLHQFKGSSIVPTLVKHLYVKKTGDSYYAICPFHIERTPSFRITPSKDLWHCYGCGASSKLSADTERQTNLNDLRRKMVIIKKMDDINHRWNKEFSEEIIETHNFRHMQDVENKYKKRKSMIDNPDFDGDDIPF